MPLGYKLDFQELYDWFPSYKKPILHKIITFWKFWPFKATVLTVQNKIIRCIHGHSSTIKQVKRWLICQFALDFIQGPKIHKILAIKNAFPLQAKE